MEKEGAGLDWVLVSSCPWLDWLEELSWSRPGCCPPRRGPGGSIDAGGGQDDHQGGPQDQNRAFFHKNLLSSDGRAENHGAGGHEDAHQDEQQSRDGVDNGVVGLDH